MAGQAPPQGPIPDLCSIEELLQAPTDGVGDAIVVPPILANLFELKIGLWDIYFAKYGNPTPSTSSASSSRSHIGDPMLGLLQRLRENPNKRAKNDRLSNNKYEIYATTDFIYHIPTDEFANFDVLVFWKAKESMFLVLSRMARDVLSVQATSVASESAFQQVEGYYQTEEQGSHRHFKEGIYDEEVQACEAILLFDEEIAQDEAASEDRSNGSKDEINFN
ncbi:zinc finger BED domain-containing protein RICESLEEPER 2-like protein [Tanacetum coccineum]